MYLPRTLLSHLYSSLLRTHNPQSASVLILPALEPDAICACRILTTLLKRDFIPHKIQPVSGYTDLERVGRELVQPLKQSNGGSGGLIICLGVGGLVDLSSLLGLEGDDESADDMSGVEVWVFDARRPWNLNNVFGGQPLDSTTTISGVEKGCIQKSYRSGKGGIIVFDDGDIEEELLAERDAFCELANMPEVEDADDAESETEREDHDALPPSNQEQEDDDFSSHGSSQSRKRKSWSDRDASDSESERPQQRRRSNSSSSISPPPRNIHKTLPQTEQPASTKELRRKLRSLRMNHEKILDQYNSLGTSYSEPVSSMLYALASELGREDNDLLWLAIVGVTSLEISGHTSTGLGTTNQSLSQNSHDRPHQSWQHTRSQRIYALYRDEVRRHNPQPISSEYSSRTTLFGVKSASAPTGPNDSSIQLVPDPRLPLLRHWSLYDSLLHSPHLAARLHTWNPTGVKRLHKLLAKMGISLQQCRQGYMHMDVHVRTDLRSRLEKYSGMYGLEGLVPQDSAYAHDQEGWGFVRSWGWKAQLSAVDVGMIVTAILEVAQQTTQAKSEAAPQSTQSTTTTEEVADRSAALLPLFFLAYDALSPTNPNKLLAAVPQAQSLLKSIHRTGSSLLLKHQIRHLRAFRMGVVKDGPDLPLFANSPGALVRLALWVAEAVAVSERDKKGASDTATPLVLAALDELRGTYVVVGTGGGIGGGEDVEKRKERAERREQRKADREQRKQEKEKKKAAEKQRRELNGIESDDEEDDESEAESDMSDSDDDEAQQEQHKRRGYGRNRFGIAFQEVVEETNARVKIDSFNHCVVEVRKEDLGGFLEGLSLKSVIGR